MAAAAATLDQLMALSSSLGRGEASALWARALADSGAHDDVQRLAALVDVERAHIACVRDAQREVTQRASVHDHSKDTWYMVVTCIAFGMQKRHLVEHLLDEIIDSHVALEPHHERYHEQRGTLPSEDDVAEMALDRLARNVQKNDGVYNWPEMERYTPKWPPRCRRESERLTQSYARYVCEYADLVQRKWNSNKPTA